MIRGVEKVAGIENRVAIETVGCAMQTVRARFQRHVDDSTGFPAVFRGGIFQHIEFLDGINGKDCRRISGNAGTVDDALTREGFAVEKSVDDISIVLCTEAGRTRGGKSAAGIPDDTGAKL